MRASVFFIALAISCSSMVLAQSSSVYKWVDSKGLVHYEDKPAPSGEQARNAVSLSTGVLNGGGDQLSAMKSLADGQRDMAQASRDAQDKEKSQKARAMKEAEHEKVCQSSRINLKTFEAGGRIATVNDKGERVMLNEDDIARRKAEAQRNADVACAPLPPEVPPQGVTTSAATSTKDGKN